jgi:5-methylcytosine-specific restriction endonuclease McrA
VLLLAASAAAAPRSAAERLAFMREQPCPATGERRGGCPGWEVDHIVPLCAGGPDTRQNLQWIRKEDHRFKTLVDVRECRKERRDAR